MSTQLNFYRGHLPIVPPALLRKHSVREKHDTRFRSCARLLQSLWRERQGFPIGTLTNRRQLRRKLGSMLDQRTADAGRNLLSPVIAHVARMEAAYRERGAFIDERRLFSNLLSSGSMGLSLFAPLRFDEPLAARVIRALVPTADVAAITRILFEHSPGRLDPDLTGDRTAFDVAIEYRRADGKLGFIGVELKYSETMAGIATPDPLGRFAAIADAAGLYKERGQALPHASALRQLAREHLLAQAGLIRGSWAEAYFILIAPSHNYHAHEAAAGYASLLSEPLPGHATFLHTSLEKFIAILAECGAGEHAAALFERYVNWWAVVGAVDAELKGKINSWQAGSPPKAAPKLIGTTAR